MSRQPETAEEAGERIREKQSEWLRSLRRCGCRLWFRPGRSYFGAVQCARCEKLR